MGVFTPQDCNHDGHIIDLNGLDHPGLDSGRNTICLREYLVVDLDQGVLSVLSHVKADRNHAPLGHGHGVDILHTIDLVEELLKGCGNLALHLLRAKTGCRHEHVRQGHDDLRFFLARCDHQCDDTTQKRAKQQDQRQRSYHDSAEQAR